LQSRLDANLGTKDSGEETTEGNLVRGGVWHRKWQSRGTNTRRGTGKDPEPMGKGWPAKVPIGRKRSFKP